jgi:hypothetical protein
MEEDQLVIPSNLQSQNGNSCLQVYYHDKNGQLAHYCISLYCQLEVEDLAFLQGMPNNNSKIQSALQSPGILSPHTSTFTAADALPSLLVWPLLLSSPSNNRMNLVFFANGCMCNPI